ncbi:3-hydroxyacyl-CoA dehydrogenase [Dethiosulfatibacter aminovorans DSM 17477]|uniref:3-hydroxyacyl-CoA dehydrogenase n=1 Tax=Dethiosulfatibacter aminovorans DSM 17477 TaxID=1121476 RepID=A0A1M6N9D5_9FIRM|nr:3-hydroxybutyryl-CoA dehydrogenase [Dethiosulfatibacter aminovorans]SHJ92329.1 3-hydroxyacyl-CoA dehydrogenase [Dethiosulfatibacter aminovorans DSM 17477]
MKICILGAGTMGSGIAQVFAQKGHEVVLRDIKEEFTTKGYLFIDKTLEKMVMKERMTTNEKNEIMDRITPTVDIGMARDCDLVIEAAVENINIKKKIFAELDKICNKNTILATNTSSLSITEIAVATERPDKVIGMHFFNPAPVMQLVEIIKGLSTSEHTFEIIKELAKSLGKTEVEVEEAPGFVVNRMLIPMINEAVGILADGVSGAEDIDNAMKLGANHPLGPLALGDLIGLDVCLFIMEILESEYCDPKYRPHPLLRKMVRGNRLGKKTGKGFFEY